LKLIYFWFQIYCFSYEEIDSNDVVHFANNVIVEDEESGNGSYEVDGPDNGSYEVDGPENSQIHFWEYEDTASTCGVKNVLVRVILKHLLLIVSFSFGGEV
jgi:hypothetical protein